MIQKNESQTMTIQNQIAKPATRFLTGGFRLDVLKQADSKIKMLFFIAINA